MEMGLWEPGTMLCLPRPAEPPLIGERITLSDTGQQAVVYEVFPDVMWVTVAG